MIVYRYFAADGALLYVGVTSNMEVREAQHANAAKWWFLVASRTTERYASVAEARAAERNGIRAERPRFNVRSRPFADRRDWTPADYGDYIACLIRTPFNDRRAERLGAECLRRFNAVPINPLVAA